MDNYLLEPVSRRQQAELNASLARNLNPQIEASLAQTSKDRGVPLGVLRAADNQSLIPPLDTEALEGTSAAVKWYADSPNNAAVSRNDELNLVNIEKVADETTRSVKERMKSLSDSVKEAGYTPEQIKDLLTAYDPDPSDSVPFSSGRATLKGMPNARAQWPTMESWVAGQNETEHITKVQEQKNAARMKSLQEFDKASFAGGFSAEEVAKYPSTSEAASAYLDKLQNEIAVMAALHTLYPNWQNLDDAQLQDMVNRVKEYTNFDTASVSIARLRKAGASDVDWGKAFNAFGMNDLLEKKVGMTDEELTKVGYDSDMFSKLEKIRRLEEISNSLRGSDGWNMTLSGIAQSIPFVTELAATSPGGAYGAAKEIIKSSGWAKGLIPATKLILGQELKRLPAFIAPESAEAVRGVGPQLTYMIDENGTRQEFLSPAQYDKLTTELTKNLIGRYISNSVEGLGNIVLPSGALESLAGRVVSAVPKAVRQKIGESMVISVVKDIAKTPKTAAAIASFRNAAEFGDIPQEYFEEKMEDWIRGISSYVGERTGIDAINFGDRLQVFKSPTEELATLGSVVGLMGVMHSPRVPAMIIEARTTARFVDGQLALKDKVDASKTASVSPGHIESYLKDYLGINDAAVLTSKAADTLFQSSPEIAAKIGLTRERIAKAELEGRNIPVSMVRAQVVLSKPELYTFLQSAAPNSATPLSLEDVKKVNITEETVKEAEAELKLRSEIKDALDGTRKELIAAGRSKSEANASARIIGSLATYFRLHSSADPIAFINGLKFRAVNEADFIKNFGADTMNQAAAAAKSVGLTKGHPVFKDDTPVNILTPIPGAPVTFGETTIRATGHIVAYNQDSVKHSRGNDGLKVVKELAPHFKEMLENAVLVETEPGVGKSSVDKVYRYYSAVEIKGKVIAAELTVFGMKNGTFKLYDCRAKDSGIKKGEAGPPVRGGRTLNPGLATSPVISIRQLLEKVKPEYFDNPDVYRQDAAPDFAIDTPQEQYDAVVKQFKGTGKWLKAPNGEDTKLTEKQWVQVRTPAFRAWFGDWENDPANASKVVDENGEPLVVHRGMLKKDWRTKEDINVIKSTNGPWAGFFTSREDVADSFKKAFSTMSESRVISVFLKIDTPYTFNARGNKYARDFMFDNTVFGQKARNPDALKAFDNGYDAVVIKNTIDEGDVFVPKNSTQIKSATENTGAFDGSNPDIRYQDARGAITFAEDYNAVVSLIEGKSDASTVVHESAHYIHRMMENLVKNNLADDRMKGDLARIDAWLSRDTTVSSRYNKAVEEAKTNGNPEPEFIKWSTTDRAERFARAFEAYILEGEAPSVETRSAFATLAKLLTAIYRSVVALNVELSSDIRRVFDGMLRTEEQAIRESAAKELLGSLNPEILGLGAEEAKVFSDLAQKASDQTVEELHEEKTKQLKVLRKEWKVAANEEMKDMPVYKAWNHIKDAGGLTYASVIKYYGKEVADDLHSKGLVLKKTEGGTDALVFAADLDYPSPSHLIGELYTAKRPSDYIAEYIESNEAAFNREFDASAIALTAEANFESLDRISRFLAEKSGRTKSMMNKELFKLKAKVELDNTRVRDVVSDTLLLGSIRQNAKDLTQAANEGDFTLAFEAAQKLRFNLEVLRQKRDAKKYITKIESVLKRGRHAKQGTIEGDFHRGIQELSYRFNFTMSGPSSVGTKSLAELIDALHEQNLLDVEWPAWLLSEYRDYRELTFEDFHVLGSMSQYLYGFGHEIIRNAKADRAATIEADIEACIAPAADMPKKYHDRKEGLADTIGRAYRGFWASSEKLSRFLREFDGFSHVGTSGKEGPNERLIFRPLSQASAVNLDIKQRIDSELAPVWAYFHKRMPELKERLSGLPAFSQEIVDNAYSKWTPEMVITAALNRGTADNYEKLKNGYGWKDSDIDKVISVLSSEDWANIQKIWDTIESMWPDLRSEFYKLNFFELEKIDAMPFDVTTSDGQTVSVKGGYYPLRYVTKLDANIERRIAAGDSESIKQLRAEPIHASADFTHRRRSGVKMPIDLRLNALVEHLDNVPHYISHRATMTRILKVVASPRYRDAFGTTRGYEKYRAMLSILQFIANPEKEKRAQAISWLNWSRAVLTTSALAFNPSSVIMQLASAPAGFSEVGAKYYFGAWQEFGLRRMELAGEISRKSSYMRDRWNFLDLDMQGQMAKLRESGVQKTVRTFNKIGFMPMKAMDMAVAFPIWYAGYRRKLDEGVGEGAAISFADELVARTQGSGRSMDLSAIQLNAVGRALTPFFSAVSAIQNHWTYGVNAMKHGKMDTRTAATFILFDLLGVIVSGAVIRYMLAGGGDEGEKAFLRELTSSPVQGIPLVRDIADFTANSYMTGKLGYKDPVAVSSLDAVNEVLRKGLLVPKKYGKDPEGALADAADVVSTVFQIPVVKIYKRGKRYYDRFFNENEGGLHE